MSRQFGVWLYCSHNRTKTSSPYGQQIKINQILQKCLRATGDSSTVSLAATPARSLRPASSPPPDTLRRWMEGGHSH